MKKIRLLGFCLIALTIGFTNFSIASENKFEMHVPMGTLILKPPLSVEPKRTNVKFPHARHFLEVQCLTCHHNWNGIDQIQSCMTSNCHDADKSSYKLDSNNKKTKKDLNLYYYKKAYHTQCIGCHKAMKEESKKVEYSMTTLNGKILITGPTGCIECHPK